MNFLFLLKNLIPDHDQEIKRPLHLKAFVLDYYLVVMSHKRAISNHWYTLLRICPQTYDRNFK